MRERKRHAIPQFIMDARAQLTDMWDKLYYPQERRAEFAIAFNSACGVLVEPSHSPMPRPR